RLLNGEGTAVPGKPVVFRVSQGDGIVGVGGTDEGAAVLATSDANGIASTRFRVGARAGSGNQRVSARAVGFEGEVLFFASATPKPGDKVSVNSGNNQRGAAHQPLPLPFVVVVSDDGANVIEGAQVEFSVVAGDGHLQNGERTFTATTDSDGRATAKLTLGEALGLDVHRVNAQLVGTHLTAGFTASALQSGAPGATSISGVVLDNQDRPLPNVTLRVENTTREAKTDVQGRFKVTEVPVGPVRLIADGSTTTVAGEWPTLPYNLVTVSGADNPLPAPVYMVKLDTAHAVMVGAEDKEITLPEVPGFKLTVKAGSVTFPNADRVGLLSVTPVNVAKIPMVPPNGMQPQFIVTIQPSGARFDPPAALELPNVDGHAPGAQVEMYSFDHDLEEFVTIGLGTVSADGTRIVSNPGVGVIKAGWHCGSPPGGDGCVAACNVCEISDPDCTCDANPIFNGFSRTAQLAADGPADDVPGDCHRPTCPGPEHVVDDSDQPQDLCKRCSNGSILDDDISNVRALVGGKDEEWAQLIDGEAEFSFAGSATTICNDTAEYVWDFGDHETATGKNVTHIYEAPGLFEVKLTVRCKGCARIEQTDTVDVAVLALTHLVQPNFGDATKRTDLGPGEGALLRVLPQTINVLEALRFDVSGPGDLAVFGMGEAQYTAPNVAGVATVAVSAPLLRNSMLVQFKTFQPNRITFTRDSVVHFDPGIASAGMTFDAELHALDDQGVEHPVSFDFVEVTELRAFAEDVDGYFATLPLPPGFDNDPVSGFVQVDAHNRLQNVFLSAALEGPLFQQPPPWTLGHFVFRIPWEYRAINDPNAVSHQITVVGREFQMEGPASPLGAGTISIVQGAACVTRSPDDFFTPCIGNN
ncbi:MAG TPA: PKD domain-containing protein, partial [Steroidobacteraceae bacterium]|nr:PKD domain-containing protein [Steroidobacteraceae bacterium]